MNLKIRRVGKALIVTPEFYLAEEDSQLLDDVPNFFLSNGLEDGIGIVLDCRNLGVSTSTGLGRLVRLYKQLAAQGMKLALFSTTESYKMSLVSTGLDGHLHSFHTEKEALEFLQS